jgi:hypothetical protein
LGKKNPKNKKGDWYDVGLTQGQELDEETQPILWTEHPTGSLCPFTITLQPKPKQ